MSTTTIRLPEELKARVAAAAERSGQTPHGFILDAIAEKTDLAERRADFVQTAQGRLERLASNGESVDWSEARDYLAQRAAGSTSVKRPSPKRRG